MMGLQDKLSKALELGAAALVHGPGAHASELRAQLEARCGEVEPLDLRQLGEGSSSSLRQEVARRLEARQGLLVLLGAEVPDHVRAVLSELVEGRLETGPGQHCEVPAGQVLVAASPVSQPAAEVKRVFRVLIPAARQ